MKPLAIMKQWAGVLLPRPVPHQELFDGLGAGDIAIDCGANVGKMTARMARRGTRVYAFEPNPHAFAVLKKRFEGNPRVTCIPKAVWTKASTMKLFLHEQSPQDEVKWSVGSSMLDAKTNIDRSRSIDVETVCLADFIEGLGGPVRLLKIDIEGAECEVIEQLIDRGLPGKIGNILVETHDSKVPELKAPTGRLRERLARQGITNVHLDWI